MLAAHDKNNTGKNAKSSAYTEGQGFSLVVIVSFPATQVQSCNDDDNMMMIMTITTRSSIPCPQ
jgi:hypothetical protein